MQAVQKVQLQRHRSWQPRNYVIQATSAVGKSPPTRLRVCAMADVPQPLALVFSLFFLARARPALKHA